MIRFDDPIGLHTRVLGADIPAEPVTHSPPKIAPGRFPARGQSYGTDNGRCVLDHQRADPAQTAVRDAIFFWQGRIPTPYCIYKKNLRPSRRFFFVYRGALRDFVGLLVIRTGDIVIECRIHVKVAGFHRERGRLLGHHSRNFVRILREAERMDGIGPIMNDVVLQKLIA